MSIKSKFAAVLTPRVSAETATVVKTPHGEFLAGPHTASYLFESACSAKLSDLAKRMDSGSALRGAAAVEIRALLSEIEADHTDTDCYGGRWTILNQLGKVAASLEAGESLANAIQVLNSLVESRRYGISCILSGASRAPSPNDVSRSAGQRLGTGLSQWDV